MGRSGADDGEERAPSKPDINPKKSVGKIRFANFQFSIFNPPAGRAGFQNLNFPNSLEFVKFNSIDARFLT